jgi:hypothetical protein
MKQPPHIKVLLLSTLITILLAGCLKDPNHSIRIKNSYSVAMSDVKINSTSYGRVEAGATTDYKHVDEGNFTLSGSSINGQALTGTGSVTGKGTHKWTLSIHNDGSIGIAED